MKKDWEIIMILFLIILIFIIFRKPIKKAMTRGYRNNNPGNIRLTYKNGKKEYWQGEIDGTDKDFKTFKSMEWGYRAMFVTLRSYLGKKYDTIEEIINRYAPSSENNTEAYIKSVTGYTGIARDELIDTEAEENLLVAALSYHENGIKPDTNEINAGHKLLV